MSNNDPNNPYMNYGYDHFGAEDTPQPSQHPQSSYPVGEDVVAGRQRFLSALVKSPSVITAALVLLAFGGAAWFLTGTDSDAPEPEVPVIQAQTTVFKQAPRDRGGMDIAYRDSSIFDDGTQGEPARRVENLLEPRTEEPVENVQAALVQGSEIPETQAAPDNEVEPLVSAAAEPPQDASPAPRQKPETMHKAGTSPETLAFVRNVLDEESQSQTAEAQQTASDLNQVEPAAGAAMPAVGTIEPGDHYVQLASVTSPSGAERAWVSAKEDYGSLLQNVAHRIQEANLGERGTYYRIQAGPMSEGAAKRLCERIKSQNPGGCLVVQK